MSLAIIYINSHHRDGMYVKEADASAASFKKFLPQAKFYLYTDYIDKKDDLKNFNEVRKCEFYVPDFLVNRVHLNGQMIVKHRAMLEVQEKHAMYLGSDTFALRPEVAYIETILEKFDIAVTHAPIRINTELGNSPLPDIPPSFPEMNCDLILYKNNAKVRQLLEEWRKAYLSDMFAHPHDQGTFRHLIYNSDLRLAILPPEYNYRGLDYMPNTVILQNRHTLSSYLSPRKDSLMRKLIRKIRR